MNTEELLKAILDQSQKKSRFLVAIAGPPGAGKSTFANELADALAKAGATHAVVPMDGFHLDNALLDVDGNRARKGSPQTFDALGFLHLINRLHAHSEEVIVPIFDRKQDQAIAGVQRVALSDRIILVEGNYLLLDESPWDALRELWDLAIFIDPGMAVLEERLVERWTRHDHDPASARERAMQNDLPNARYVIERSNTADALRTSGV